MKITITIESTQISFAQSKQLISKATKLIVEKLINQNSTNFGGNDCIQPVGNRDESNRKYFAWEVQIDE